MLSLVAILALCAAILETQALPVELHNGWSPALVAERLCSKPLFQTYAKKHVIATATARKQFV